MSRNVIKSVKLGREIVTGTLLCSASWGQLAAYVSSREIRTYKQLTENPGFYIGIGLHEEKPYQIGCVFYPSSPTGVQFRILGHDGETVNRLMDDFLAVTKSDEITDKGMLEEIRESMEKAKKPPEYRLAI